MREIININYRGIHLELDKELFEEFKKRHGYSIETEDIDQYAFNESDKSIPDESVLAQKTGKTKLEEIVNTYLRIENEVWR